jgi:hypothetical protein
VRRTRDSRTGFASLRWREQGRSFIKMTRGRPFTPGVSGNPGGRPKGAHRFASLIRKHTRHGRELIDLALRVMRDEQTPLRDRLRAMEFLTERMLGKAVQAVDLAQVSPATEPLLDYSVLSLEELDQYSKILKALGDRQPDSSPLKAG